jgi:hypothetical protein
MTAEANFNVPVLTEAVDAEEFQEPQTPTLRVEALSLTRHEPRTAVEPEIDPGIGPGIGPEIGPGIGPEIDPEIPTQRTADDAVDAVSREDRQIERAIDRQILIAELQTEIAAHTFTLADKILRSAFAEMEASIFQQISGRLRRELPEMIDELLRERLGDDTDY